jgi:hypothetical protein
MPAALGKLFRVATRHAPEQSAHSRSRSRWRTMGSRKSSSADSRVPASVSRRTSSGRSSPLRNSTVVWVRHSRNVIETEGAYGMARSRSFAPQYLTRATLDGASTVAFGIWEKGVGEWERGERGEKRGRPNGHRRYADGNTRQLSGLPTVDGRYMSRDKLSKTHSSPSRLFALPPFAHTFCV